MSQKIQLNEQEVIRAYSQLQSQRKVAELFGVSTAPIIRILDKHKVSKNSSRKYQMDFDYFESIDTPNKAYWLGFLYADGYVRKRKSSSELKLKLGKKDIGHVEKFKECIKAEHPIKDEHVLVTVNGKEHHSNCCYISLSSRKLIDDLIDKGCGNKKTFIIEFPYWLDDDLVRHFIRGYFDGDGHISIKKDRFLLQITTGSEEMVNGIINVLENVLGMESKDYSVYRHEGRYYRIHFNKSFGFKFAEFLYEDCEVYLERKREKYLSFTK